MKEIYGCKEVGSISKWAYRPYETHVSSIITMRRSYALIAFTPPAHELHAHLAEDLGGRDCPEIAAPISDDTAGFTSVFVQFIASVYVHRKCVIVAVGGYCCTLRQQFFSESDSFTPRCGCSSRRGPHFRPLALVAGAHHPRHEPPSDNRHKQSHEQYINLSFTM